MTPEIHNLKNSCQKFAMALNMIQNKEWSGHDVEAVAQVKAFLASLHDQSLKKLQKMEFEADRAAEAEVVEYKKPETKE